MNTVLSGNIKDVGVLLNELCKDHIIVESTSIISTKNYWNEDGTKVIKSDDTSLTVLVTYKPK